MRRVAFRASLALFLACAAFGPASANLSKLDPRARTALGALRARAPLARLLESRMAVTAQGQLDVFIRGSASRSDLEAAGAIVRSEISGIFTAFVPVDAVERVAALSGVQRITGASPVELELDASVPAIGVGALRGPGPSFAGANGAGILIGDVDSGVDYGHGDFDDAAGNTRLVTIWDQNIPGTPPSGYAYGSEWSSAQIDANTCPQTDGIGHGTHVLGIAGGDGSQTGNGVPAYTYAGVAPRADLVMVNSDFNDTHVVDGVRYCFDLATARAQSAVVNLSLGSQYGPHDGTSDFESSLSALSGPGRIIVKSAGNDRTSNRHAEIFATGAGDSATLTVSGSSNGAQFLIDGYYESTQNIRVTVRTPAGNVIGPITRGNANGSYPIGTDTPNGNVYIENGLTTTSGGDYEIYVETSGGASDNLNGIWSFIFTPVAVTTGEIDLWRFYSSTGLGVGWVAGANAQELVSEPGNANEVITVAAWTTKNTWTDCFGTPHPQGTSVGSLASFSSPGPTRDGRQKPDIAAPGAVIASTNDFDVFAACGSSSQLVNDGFNHRVDQGTSMAAPHVTGAVALLLQSYGPKTPAQIKSLLFALARTDGNTGAVWNADWGNGKLFLDGTVDALLSLFDAQASTQGIILRWRFGDPSRFASVSLERAEALGGPWSVVDAERHREQDAIVALDRGAVTGTRYYYRLVALSVDGSSMVFGPLAVTSGESLKRFLLEAVRPNPTQGAARIDFVVPREGDIRVSIHDLQGREIAVLAQGSHRPGRYQAVWNGTIHDVAAPSGVYFVNFATPDGLLTQRVAIAR